MLFLYFLAAAYAFIALVASFLTYNEQQSTGDRSLMLKCAGFLACLLWPLTFVAVVVAARTA